MFSPLEDLERDFDKSLSYLDRTLDRDLSRAEGLAKKKKGRNGRRALAYSLPVTQVDAVHEASSPVPKRAPKKNGGESYATEGVVPIRRLREEEERVRQLQGFNALPAIAPPSRSRSVLEPEPELKVDAETGYAELPLRMLSATRNKPGMATLSRHHRRSKVRTRQQVDVVMGDMVRCIACTMN